MVEAAIVGRPVFTVTPPEFADTQSGTLHFRHLLPENGGFLRRAASLEEHLGQLAETLRDDAATHAELRGFVSRFIRPLGLDRDATGAFVAAVEEAAAAGAHAPVAAGPALRVALRALGAAGRLDRALGPQRLASRLSSRAQADRARAERAPKPVRSLAGAWASSLERLSRRVRTAPRATGGHALAATADQADDLLQVDA